MLVDTDVLIWNLRGNPAAADRLDAMQSFSLSAVSYMELVQGLRNKRELHQLRQGALDHFAGVDAGRGDGAPEQRLEVEQAMLAVEEQGAEHLVLVVLKQYLQIVEDMPATSPALSLR